MKQVPIYEDVSSMTLRELYDADALIEIQQGGRVVLSVVGYVEVEDDYYLPSL